MRPAASGGSSTRRIFCRGAGFHGNEYLGGMASSRLIYNIKQLVNVRRESRLMRGREMADLPCIDDAWLLVEGDRIAGYGEMRALPPGLEAMIGVRSAPAY